MSKILSLKKCKDLSKKIVHRVKGIDLSMVHIVLCKFNRCRWIRDICLPSQIPTLFVEQWHFIGLFLTLYSYDSACVDLLTAKLNKILLIISLHHFTSKSIHKNTFFIVLQSTKLLLFYWCFVEFFLISYGSVLKFQFQVEHYWIFL